jgi:hypothetical protein
MGSGAMNQSTKKCGMAALLADSGACIGEHIAQTTCYFREEIVPLVLGTSVHAKRKVTRILVSWGCLALTVVLVSQPCSSGQRLIETGDWTLSQLVNHLHAQGLTLHVVPTRKSGIWSNSIYLTADPHAAWLCFQQKSRNVERIEQWQGIVLVEQLSKEPGPQWDVSQWGENGLQIDRFVLFGDADLIRRIGQSVMISQPRSVLSRLLSSK